MQRCHGIRKTCVFGTKSSDDKERMDVSLSLRLCRVIASLYIDASNLLTATDNHVLMSDFHPWPVGNMEQ